MKKLIVSIFCILLSPTSEALTFGYTTGNMYMQMDQLNRMIWATGVADGIMAKAFLDNGPDDKLIRCMSNMHPTQMHVMFEQELRANPESMSYPAAILLYSHLKKKCGV